MDILFVECSLQRDVQRRRKFTFSMPTYAHVHKHVTNKTCVCTCHQDKKLQFDSQASSRHARMEPTTAPHLNQAGEIEHSKCKLISLFFIE